MPRPRARGGSASATRSSTRCAQQALANSPTLALADARLAQARAVLAATSAAVLPQVGLGARAARQQISANRPLTNYASPNFSTVQNDLVLALSVSYEFDLAGRVQRIVEGARRVAEQSAADLENIRLLLTADLATAYFNLRAIDIELDVLARSIALQRRALELRDARATTSAPPPGLDVAQQQALLDTTLMQVDLLQRQRGQFEHAIATLTGTPAPMFALAPDIARARRRRRCRSACRPTCWSAGPTSRRPSARWRRPTRRSASPARRSIRASRSAPALAASRAARCRRCSTRRACSGRSACRPRRCCSTAAA